MINVAYVSTQEASNLTKSALMAMASLSHAMISGANAKRNGTVSIGTPPLVYKAFTLVLGLFLELEALER